MAEQRFESAPPLSQPEPLKARPEMRAEKAGERVMETAARRATERVPVTQLPPTGAIPQVRPSAPAKSETRVQIEQVMEERLKDVYRAMTPADQQKFKKKGEETAEQIEVLLYKIKLHTKKVFELLFVWLKLIPSVNKYFLEQEAKLKTDEIVRIKEEMDRMRGRERHL